MFAGNQGYQVDGELVKAGLILPLDEYAKAYGWDKSYTPETLQQFEWTDDGQTFGEGTLWGVAQSGQSTGVFANKAKLEAAGVDPASMKTFADFEAALPKLKASLPADEPVIALGNKDQFGAIHLWGMVQGAYTPAQDIRDWIFQKDGATFDTPGNLESLQKIKEWADKGYIGRVTRSTRATTPRPRPRSARARARSCSAATGTPRPRRTGSARTPMFFDMPPGDSGKKVAIGSASLPMHISAKTKQPDLAAAYLDFITGPTRARRWSTPSRCRRRPTGPPSRATRSARRSRRAGTSSSRTAA